MTTTSPEPLSEARDVLETIDSVDVDERPEVFATIHTTLVTELAALDEV